MISIVSPVYRAENILPILVSEIIAVMQNMQQDYEIILVDDRSPDASWTVMKNLAATTPKLKIYRLSKNFGQHATIMAGLARATGDWIVVMDCDMQDQPKEIKKLYKKTKEGFDIVVARRVQRKDKLIKRLSSNFFYRSFNYLADIKSDSEIANFGIYNKKVIDAVLSINDYIKFFPLFVQWSGFNSIAVAVEHADRQEGKSSYSIRKLFSLAFNVIISFSDKPLKIFVAGGLAISGSSLVGALWLLIWYNMGKITQPGYSSLMLSIWFLSGIIISSIGIVGLYLGKTFNQTKDRPVYIIDESFEH